MNVDPEGLMIPFGAGAGNGATGNGAGAGAGQGGCDNNNPDNSNINPDNSNIIEVGLRSTIRNVCFAIACLIHQEELPKIEIERPPAPIVRTEEKK